MYLSRSHHPIRLSRRATSAINLWICGRILRVRSIHILLLIFYTSEQWIRAVNKVKRGAHFIILVTRPVSYGKP